MHALLFDWPYAGLVLAAVLVWVLVREAPEAGPQAWRNPTWVLGWLWPMYLLHQFEEHGIDLLGLVRSGGRQGEDREAPE